MTPVQADQGRIDLLSPTAMPNACGFLWNRSMMIQMNCRGFATAQFMQPEPAKYTTGPALEAKTFMQPEQPYYAHHPGRFFYFKDEVTGELFSAPHEPVRAEPDKFLFSVGQSDLCWVVEKFGLRVTLRLTLPPEDVAELWEVSVENISEQSRRISFYPYMPFGYRSWMNQSGAYDSELGAVLGRCITPYQKVEQYFENMHLKDIAYLLHDRQPDAWEVNQNLFEGEGGLRYPDGIAQDSLSNGDALYETPAAILQYRLALKPGQSETYHFVLGPALDEAEIRSVRERLLTPDAFKQAQADYHRYVTQGQDHLKVDTPDPEFNQFVNHWLTRQVFYHGDVNRLSTDPQTRNYLQDNMGLSYFKPEVTRAAFMHALSQQEPSGAMPDGILLRRDAELKYINQVPHTDHCVWLPVCLRAYLDETGDYELLDEVVRDWEGDREQSVFVRISNAMRWLAEARDERGLSYIAQGDWCDPMNMVGYKGQGVSGWLSVASAWALNLWADICAERQETALEQEFRTAAADINQAVNDHLWDGEWYGRGITDDNVTFGIQSDPEGRIYLNPQSWAMLAGTCNEEQQQAMIAAAERELETPYGIQMFAPAYTAMRDDVGRVTQKFPGSAENGSVYNHAAAFYIYALYQVDEGDRAWKLLRQMIPGPDAEDYLRRGQLPVYIPNYYRGAWRQHPRTAGRSSHLFNTGTVAWYYRCVVEGLLGLKGERGGLRISPSLPGDWNSLQVQRTFRGAVFDVSYRRDSQCTAVTVHLDGTRLEDNLIPEPRAGQHYQVQVTLP
ncbi:NdvB protein [Natronospirillum operosum]|uniref:NdvB protein n=1 Tax=Natronospirillum operosum TaxID=2759953 RepID=A0A4Z0WFC8_9GAMM|nr:NdvB protein [Natronospirillum operosum]TGG93200.1 NdvB protein [Natronospirillum operosum]